MCFLDSVLMSSAFHLYKPVWYLLQLMAVPAYSLIDTFFVYHKMWLITGLLPCCHKHNICLYTYMKNMLSLPDF